MECIDHSKQLLGVHFWGRLCVFPLCGVQLPTVGVPFGYHQMGTTVFIQIADYRHVDCLCGSINRCAIDLHCGHQHRRQVGDLLSNHLLYWYVASLFVGIWCLSL